MHILHFLRLVCVELFEIYLKALEKDGGFPGSSVGKESTCNAGDPSSIPGLGRSPGEGTGYPFQYSWASLVAHLVKNLPAVWENWVRSLGWEDPLDKGKATHSSILAWRIPSPWGCKELDTTEQLSLDPTRPGVWPSDAVCRMSVEMVTRAHISTYTREEGHVGRGGALGGGVHEPLA